MCGDRRKKVLAAVIKRYKDLSRNVKIDEIENETGITKPVIMMELNILKGLDLVRSRHGPKGGYRPTAHAYRKLI